MTVDIRSLLVLTRGAGFEDMFLLDDNPDDM